MRTSIHLVAAAMVLAVAGCALGSDTKPLVKEMVVTTAVDIQSAHPYANHTRAEWTLQAPEGALSIGVTFDRFKTEAGFDFVNLYDGDGVLVHHLSGDHTGEFFDVHGRTLRIELVTDYSIRHWGLRILEYRYEMADPGHPVDHRPYCDHVGTPAEGWYWGDTEQLIELKRCGDKAEPQCGAIGSHSEGWFTSAPDPFITWDSGCHLLAGVGLLDDPCDGDSGLTCHTGLQCEGAAGTTPGLCRPIPQGVWSWTSHLIQGVASDHPYANNTDESFTVTGSPGATQIKVYFSRIDTEAGYDQLVLSGNVEEIAHVLDGHHTDLWSPVFNGNTINLQFQSDYSVTDWGFAATMVSYYEQLPVGACNADADCTAAEYCFPHHCFNPYAPCYGHCAPRNGGDEGDVCDGASRLCAAGLFCKGLNAIGEGTCADELWCAAATVAADCANVMHPAVPGQWACVADQCAWQAGLPPVVITNNQKYDIPDDDPSGVQSDITVSNAPTCDLTASVDLHVDHTYRGDLVVVLTGPNGQTQTLHDREGYSADNLDLQQAPVDGALLTGGAAGTWSLHVSDHAAWDEGTLTYWTLRLVCN